MADSPKGVLGGLPPLPRKPLNASVIAAEQAYRKRKGWPLLAEQEIADLTAGSPMWWEEGGSGLPPAPSGDGQPAAASTSVTTAPPPPAAEPKGVAAPAQAQPASPGVQGGLPNLPRKPLNASVIAAEQAYRKRKGMALLTDAEIEDLKAGNPMWWEPGGSGTPPSINEPAAEGIPAGAPAQPAAMPPQPAAAAAPMSNVQGGLPNLPRKPLNNSVISAEQAYRKKKGIPQLNPAEIACLKAGNPMPWEPGGVMPDAASIAEATGAAAPAPAAAPATAPAAARPAAAAPARPAAPVGPAATRTGTATTYVGTPAVGTSQAAAAAGVAATGPENSPINQARRRLVWASVAAFLATWLIAFFRFFLPRTLFEPSTVFKIGYASDYGIGVDTKFQQKFRIWVDRTPDRLFVIYARCTHLGCTPDWKPGENKFKCPCHGSGYDSEGINFEGPAPRPMDRAHVEVDAQGQIVVDTSRLYQQPKGQKSQFNDAGAFIAV
jgi:cytochrome b6-f complex iron-sulfur subunit